MSDQNITPLSLSLLAIAAITVVLLRYRTVLLGFTFFSFFNIASASLAAFLTASTFGLSQTWVTPAHRTVFTSTSLGLIAFSAGAWLAWRPLRGKGSAEIWHASSPTELARLRPRIARQPKIQTELSTLPWLNIRFAILCLALSVPVYLLTPIAFAIPTVRVIWSTFYSLLPLGMLVMLIYSRLSRNYTPLLLSFIAFIPLVLLNAVTTGHIGAGGAFIIQLVFVASFSFGIQVRTIPLFVISSLLLTSLFVGWMASRSIIRSGQLANYNETDRITIFLQRFEFTSPLELSPTQVQDVVRLRLDMSDILVAQAYYQPQFEPYAYGGTIFSNLAAALVPRFLWDGKPRFVGGSEFVSKYTGINFGRNVSVGLPYQFELYANGGVAGVVGGLFILGWLTAYLELRLVNGNYSLPNFLVLSYLTSAIAAGAQTIVAVILTILAGIIGFFLLGRILEGINPNFHFWRDTIHSSTGQQKSARRPFPHIR